VQNDYVSSNDTLWLDAKAGAGVAEYGFTREIAEDAEVSTFLCVLGVSMV